MCSSNLSKNFLLIISVFLTSNCSGSLQLSRSEIKARVLIKDEQNTSCSKYACDVHVMSSTSTEIGVRWLSQKNDLSKSFYVVMNNVVVSACTQPVEQKNYTCTADNRLPNTNYKVEVKTCASDDVTLQNCVETSKSMHAFTNPLAPETFTADAADSKSIKFVWTLPNQTLDDLDVIALAKFADLGGSKSLAAQAGETMVMVEGLQPLTKYTANLVVINGNANAQDTSKDEHLVLTAPNPPTISIPHVGGTWIQVQFAPMPGGEALGLVYSAETTDEYGVVHDCSIKASNQDAHCTIEQLQPSTNYTITAKACVGTTCSEMASAQHITTDSKGPTQLSRGAIAGIVVGVIAGVILIALIIACIYTKRKNSGTADLKNSKYDTGSGDFRSLGTQSDQLSI